MKKILIAVVCAILFFPIHICYKMEGGGRGRWCAIAYSVDIWQVPLKEYTQIRIFPLNFLPFFDEDDWAKKQFERILNTTELEDGLDFAILEPDSWGGNKAYDSFVRHGKRTKKLDYFLAQKVTSSEESPFCIPNIARLTQGDLAFLLFCGIHSVSDDDWKAYFIPKEIESDYEAAHGGAWVLFDWLHQNGRNRLILKQRMIDYAYRDVPYSRSQYLDWHYKDFADADVLAYFDEQHSAFPISFKQYDGKDESIARFYEHIKSSLTFAECHDFCPEAEGFIFSNPSVLQDTGYTHYTVQVTAILKAEDFRPNTMRQLDRDHNIVTLYNIAEFSTADYHFCGWVF